MNAKLKAFQEQMQQKKVAVLGLGISNRPLIRYLHRIGVTDITGFDKMDPASDLAAEMKAEIGDAVSTFSLGEAYLEPLFHTKFDYVFKTPVVRYDIPALLKAKELGAVITSEMEVFMQLCPATMFAVTGSDGKTTTTTLIYKMLTEAGYTTWLGGNIGRPLLSDIDRIEEDHMVVLELSSFQLHTMTVSPHVAVVTNLSPNHLDVHKSYAEYIEAKSNIFAHQKAAAGDYTVLNAQNPPTAEYAKQVPAGYRFFSRTKPLQVGVWAEDDTIYYRKSEETEKVRILDTKDILLPGQHNIENYMAAIGAVVDFVSPAIIEKVAKTFGGVEHRLELVRVLDGVKYYNSSIDSSPSRTIAALGTFQQKILLIAGGKDKGIPYDEIGPHILDRVKKLFLIGPTAAPIAAAVKKEAQRRGIENLAAQLEIVRCSSYEEIVAKASQKAKAGDCVLLSPASTSFDMFRNFEQRGQTFKRLVNALKSKEEKDEEV